MRALSLLLLQTEHCHGKEIGVCSSNAYSSLGTGQMQPLWIGRMRKSSVWSHQHPPYSAGNTLCLPSGSTLVPALTSSQGKGFAQAGCRGLLTRVLTHVNELPGHAGCAQCPFNNSFGGPHKGVDGTVGGGASVHIQQHAARCPGDGLPQCLDHLPKGTRWLGWRDSHCSPSSCAR